MSSSSCSVHWRSVRSTLGLTCIGLVAACAGVEPADEPTSAVTSAVTATAGATTTTPTTAFTPNDTHYGKQWSYPQIGLPDAWGITLGKPAVRIAIFDSGSTDHPDLAGRFTGGIEFVDTKRTLDPVDKGAWHHGTHVAGILGALTNNATGGAGICPGCTLIPVRLATPEGALILDNYKNALSWAAGDFNNGTRQADIVTLSMNLSDASTCPQDVEDAVQHAIANGVVVVNSAGNYASTTPHQPANCAGIISVAATQMDKSLAAYSDRGAVTLAAPGGAGEVGANGQAGGGFGSGVDCRANNGDTTLGIDSGIDGILSTWALYPIVSPASTDYCYRYLSGTSMSAPHVAGTVGLMLSAAPTNVTFTPAQITKLLTLTAEHVACANINGSNPNGCGAGLLDARAAVTAASQGGLPRLTLAPSTMAFGSVPVNSASADQLATAKAIGVGPVTISSIELTGSGASQFQIDRAGCGQLCNGPITVPEDNTFTIPVRCLPTVAGAASASLVVHSNSDTNNLTIPLSCTATAPQLVVDVASIDFQVSHLGTPAPTRPVNITNAGNAPLSFQATTGAPFSLVCTNGSVCNGTLQPGGHASFAVGYTSTVLGLQTGAVTIISNDPLHASVPISLRGTGGIGVGAVTSVAFGDVPVGSAALGAAVVTNSGNVPLAISAIDIADATDFELAYASGPCAGATHCTQAQQVATTLTIPVRCHPRARGPATSQITLTTDGSSAQVTGQLTCNGITPHLVLGGAPLTFGTVAIGASASADVTVANTTAGTQLSFTASQGSSQYALSCVSGCTCADDICSGFVGATPATVRVTFAPTQVGAQSANVTFSTNDPDAPTTTLQATGTGSGPVFQRISPVSGELAFMIPFGQSSDTQTVEIGNAGNAPLHISAVPVSGAAASGIQVSTLNGLPVAIPPGLSAKFAVTCTPSWISTRSAQMTFTADAGTTTIIDITCARSTLGPPPPGGPISPPGNPDPPPPVTQ